MSVWQTVLYFVVPTVAIMVVIAAMVLVPRAARRPRYRVGEPWPHGPQFWTANPEGAALPAVGTDAAAVAGERGGARGRW